MASVSIHFWAGARAAAGVSEDHLQAFSANHALRQAVERHPGLARVLPACSFLVDGMAAHADDLERMRTGAVQVDVLPPFAGG